MADTLYPRFAHEHVVEALGDTPVVAVNGARQVGKSTLVEQLVEREPGARLVTLDDAIQLEAARADPGAFVDHDGLLVIDEVQRAPELLPAIKATVDRARAPGRFLLTGSTRLLSVAETSESLAGRIEIIDLWPLSQGELRGRQERFVDAAFSGVDDVLVESDLTRRDYDELMVAGGFPEPLGRAGARRRAWFANYSTTVLERMVSDTADIDRLTAMPRLLRLCAARTSGELNVADIARDAAIPYRTVGSYLGHLQSVFLVQLIPAWSRQPHEQGRATPQGRHRRQRPRRAPHGHRRRPAGEAQLTCGCAPRDLRGDGASQTGRALRHAPRAPPLPRSGRGRGGRHP